MTVTVSRKATSKVTKYGLYVYPAGNIWLPHRNTSSSIHLCRPACRQDQPVV